MIERFTRGEPTDAIATALDILPMRIRQRLAHVRFFLGDAMRAGIHRYPGLTDTAHCAYGYHLARPNSERTTMVVLPLGFEREYATWGHNPPAVVVHELGHALHQTVDWFVVEKAVTEYAKLTAGERFAEAFAAWLCPSSSPKYASAQEPLYRDCPATLRLFADLS